MNQSIRLIGGRFRGKKLHFPAIDGLRPTPDRVRETIFNWLMNDIRDARCLDAFAGSGALGFEALSRGAARAVLIEQSPVAYAHLKKQAVSFNTPHLTVIKMDACAYLQQTTDQFDIIFLDPPFTKNYLPQCLALLSNSNTLAVDGLLYVESPHLITTDPSQWELLKSKQSGQVVYSLYRKR